MPVPADFVNLFDFEERARGRLPKDVWAYFSGGAGSEVTLRANRQAFEEATLRPRVLAGGPTKDLSATVLGQTIDFPLLIAPTAFQKLAHPQGELAAARAAAQAGVPYVLSTWSNTLLEDVAPACPGRLWFQLYVYKDRGVTRSLIERAEQAGAQAIVVTVDTPLPGKREADHRNQFRLPDHLELVNLAASGAGPKNADTAGAKLSLYVGELMDPALSWKDIEWLRSLTKLPILLKGILRGDDARKALDHGADGVIVSNHGGRQLDTAIASLRALPEIALEIGERGAVLVDGGVRRGVDIVKALALGAHAVLVGRPILWGMAVAGEEGVAAVLAMLRAEFALALALAGCRTSRDIAPDLVSRRGPLPEKIANS